MRSITSWRPSSPTPSGPGLLGLAVRVVAAALLAATPSVATTGTLVHGGTVHRVDDLGTAQVEFDALVALGSGAAVTTATRSGDSWLAVVDPAITAPQSLVRFDAATGAELDALFITLPAATRAVSTLGTGPNGLLWVLSRGYPENETVLGQLDPVTGLVTRIAAIPGILSGLTVADGEVYTFVESTAPDDEGQIARLELATGALDIVGELPGSSCSSGGDLAIDDGGAVHLAVSLHTCGVILPSFEVLVLSYRPQPDGSFALIAPAVPDLFGEPAALEVTGSVSVVDVPTLGTGGLALLIGLLGLGGVLLIRRGLRQA